MQEQQVLNQTPLQQAPLVWGEIAVEDMARAKAFYQAQFGVRFRDEQMFGMEMAILETEAPQAASIALVKHDMMRPSGAGSILYLHLSDHLAPLVERLEQNDVEIALPAMAIKEGECGYSCIIVDSEGNRVGLWAPSLKG
ncbi:VOC family protein [Shewanella alkalitolerans]|uniref:VOC family protein n=1 Tax=Shewanella alkalitolerans TaxID=2864209 RepID=UPI001C6577EE|nr:VOC family protein [Shewanella alkalitolerans]QYJ96470.1 VOC family protein [Shewanella alkalitolerans]